MDRICSVIRPKWTVPACFASLLTACTITGVFVDISLLVTVLLLLGIFMLEYFIQLILIDLTIDGEVTRHHFAAVSDLSFIFAIASLLCTFYFPIFVWTLNLILISFTLPHLCMYIRIRHKFNHRLIAICISLIVLTVIACGFAFDHHSTTVIPVATVLVMTINMICTSLYALRTKLNLRFWLRICLGPTILYISGCVLSHFYLPLLIPSLVIASISSCYVLIFIHLLLATRAVHVHIEVLSIFFLLCACVSGWLLSQPALSGWLFAASVGVVVAIAGLLTSVSNSWNEDPIKIAPSFNVKYTFLMVATIAIVLVMIADLFFINFCLASLPAFVAPMMVLLALMYLALMYTLNAVRVLINIWVFLVTCVCWFASFGYCEISAFAADHAGAPLEMRARFLGMFTMPSLVFLWCFTMEDAMEDRKRLEHRKCNVLQAPAQAAAPLPAPAPIPVVANNA